MFSFKVVCLFSVILSFGSSAYGYTLNDYNTFITTLARQPEYQADFEQNIEKLLKQEPNYFNYTPFNENYTFECDTQNFVSAQVPKSVHRLRPGDINVIAALGDSITAAAGGNAKTILGLLTEYRERSWSIGGKSELEEITTLPNVFKKFNPTLKGASMKNNVILSGKEGKGLNVAVSGDESNDMPTQAARLVQRFRESKEIDFENDWKLVTIFIGGNDLCRYGTNKELHSPQRYIDEIQQGIDILYKELPRTFVNLVSSIDSTQVKDLNKGLVCTVLHKFLCGTAAFPESPAFEDELKEVFAQYSNYTNNIVTPGKWDGRDDFAVVVQPMFQEFKILYTPDGQVDLSYFAPDCFHFSAKGHAVGAIGLWNNLLQPVGHKSNTFTPGEKLLCPTKEHPYLFTSKNS